MLCPNCGKTLSEIKIKNVTVDVCREGCGGLWLDNFELSKIDEAHESAGEELTRVLPAHPKTSHPSAKRPCPKCEGVFMRRFFATIKREVEIDECPQCAGTWLDAGELAALRAEYKTEAERAKAAETFFSQNFDQALHAEALQTQMNTASREKAARALKYVLPSYWLPGKQKGGAF
jgi:hypothetical protein